jgi:hypothetical protein
VAAQRKKGKEKATESSDGGSSRRNQLVGRKRHCSETEDPRVLKKQLLEHPPTTSTSTPKRKREARAEEEDETDISQACNTADSGDEEIPLLKRRRQNVPRQVHSAHLDNSFVWDFPTPKTTRRTRKATAIGGE